MPPQEPLPQTPPAIGSLCLAGLCPTLESAGVPILSVHYAVSREPRGFDDRPACVLGDIAITRASDALSPAFAAACASGRIFREVEIRVGGRSKTIQHEVQRLRLRDVTLSGFQFVADPTNGSVNEVIRLKYGEMEASGYSRDTAGSVTRTETASWRAEVPALAS